MRRAVRLFPVSPAAPSLQPAAPASAKPGMRDARGPHGHPRSERRTDRRRWPHVAGRFFRDCGAAMRIVPGTAFALAALSAAAWTSPFAPDAALARACFQADVSKLESHRHYRSRRDDCDVHGPAKSLDGGKPEGASAKCRDGTWSFSHTRSGTCSRHGGVARWESGRLMGPLPGYGADPHARNEASPRGPIPET